VVEIPKQNSRSDVTLASLDDVSGVEQRPCVTQICDLHVAEMLNKLDTFHCLIAPRVLADIVFRVSFSNQWPSFSLRSTTMIKSRLRVLGV
jgi:hypothetical protein